MTSIFTHNHTDAAFAGLDIARRRNFRIPDELQEIDGVQAALLEAAAQVNPLGSVAFPTKAAEVDKQLTKAATAATVATERQRIAALWASEIRDRVPPIVAPCYDEWTDALVADFDRVMTELREASTVLPAFAEQVPEHLDEKLFGEWQKAQTAVRSLEGLVADRSVMATVTRDVGQREYHQRGMPLNSRELPMILKLTMPTVPTMSSIRIEDRREFGSDLVALVEQWHTIIDNLNAAFGVTPAGPMLTMLGQAINSAGKVTPAGKWQMLLAGERSGWYSIRLVGTGQYAARCRQRDVYATIGLAVADQQSGGVHKLAADIAELTAA